KPETNLIIKGQSGLSTLDCSVSSSSIRIKDLDNSVRFHAELNKKTGLIGFVLNNKGWQEDKEARHPDIYPAKLVKQAINFFREQGETVKGIDVYLTYFPHGVMNEIYLQYADYLLSLGDKTVSEDDQK